MSTELFLTALGIAATLGALLRFSVRQKGLRRALRSGQANGFPPRLRRVWEEGRAAQSDAERALSQNDLAAYFHERRQLARRLPRVLGRISLFWGAALGLIELSFALNLGELRWTGVACLGLGAFAQATIYSLSRRLPAEADDAFREASHYSFSAPQTFRET